MNFNQNKFVSLLIVLFVIYTTNLNAQCSYNINSLGGNDLVDWNGHHISKVEIFGDAASTINNSNSNTRYTDYTSQSVNVTAGNTYSFSIENNKGGNTWGSVEVAIWIDYDNNENYTQVFSQHFGQNNNTSHTITGSFTVKPSANLGTSKIRIQAAYCDNCSGNAGVLSSDGCDFTNTYRGDVEDYTLNVVQASATPVVIDDQLEVVVNSGSGIDNQIDVSTNDYVGTVGGDSDNYALASSPSNGIVTELTDGVFEYIPNANYLGADSFTYTLCNNINQCETGIVNITVTDIYCTPVASTNGGIRYLSNVTLPGETITINNNSGDGDGYEDFSHLPAADLYFGNTYDLSILIGSDTQTLNAANHRSGWVAFIDFNQDGIFDTGTERIYRSGGNGGGEEPNTAFPYATQQFIVPATALSGNTRMRIGMRQYWSPGEACSDSSANVLDYEDYTVNIGLDPNSPQDITVIGNNTNITNGQTETTYSSFTDFGTYDINGGAKSRVFTITNNGSLPLVLGALPVQFQVGSSPDFTVTAQPATGTSIASGASETFIISFDPSAINNNITAVVVITSDDPDENPFTFSIRGEGDVLYPDTDGDGVSDNIDIDDDNDGIADGEEQLQCLMYSNSTVVETEFLNEDFGAGINRSSINGNTPGVTTSYCYEDGVNGQASGECDGDVNLNDGEYTVHYSITNGDSTNTTVTATGENIATFAYYAWYKGEDHTPGDTNGRMAIFNAAEDPGVFYETAISGILPNVPVNYSFWALNIDNADNRFSAGELPRINPNITVKFLTTDYATELASFDTGDITRCDSGNSCVDSVWKEFGTTLSFNESEFIIQFINNSPGGLGNDLALDDIRITQTLCDLDGDGVADVFDLDNDNDGIPNVYEFGGYLSVNDFDRDGLVWSDVSWVDANGNGMHDNLEGQTALDSDGDGVPDYIDLDSDNDSVFDVVENDGFGDLDIDGDGVGDGTDAGTGVNNDNFDNDGLLALIDGNDDDADESDHGAGINGYNFPVDSDGDGIPDYLDIDSNDSSNNVSNGTDISQTIFYSLDSDNNGVIDVIADADHDGVSDAFDTSNIVYGSPRDLDGSYSLFFDGRNDYVEDTTILTSGDASLSAWVKTEGSNTTANNQVIAGQSNIYIRLNTDNTVSFVLNGSAIITSSTVVNNNIWTHVAVSTNGSSSVLYINGEQEGNTSSGGVALDSSNFTIGKLANVDNNYFHGEIDEVRVYNISLTSEEIQKTVYQELDESTNFNQGLIIPKDISANSTGANLLKYYKMDIFKDDITDNKVTSAIDLYTGAKLYNIKNIYFQTAPLPYQTNADGSWTDSASWLHGNVWDIAAVVTNKDWSIVQINNNITTNNSHTNLGLIISDNNLLEVNNDNYINNTWYLSLNGTIDLKSDSQLIQTNTSDLVTSINGKIYRRQEGLSNVYRYNYWGSPVGALQNTSLSNNNASGYVNNATFQLNQLKDNTLSPIEFTTAYDEIGKISTYWTYTFENGYSYYHWNNINATDPIDVGVGYIHKGTGLGGSEFQYVFEGRPNNGLVSINGIDTGGPGSVGGSSKTEYLLGNPYPSALDTNQFINDNAGVISGEIYLWEQWAGDTHVLAQYQGGYATLNLWTYVEAYQFVGLNGADNGSQDGTKTPTRYLPVAQGFIVEVENTGEIQFNNNQRIFKTEASGDSVFFRTSDNSTNSASSTSQDSITSLRLQFKTQNNLGRELVLGFSNFTTDDYDYGYDSKAYELNSNDLYLPLQDKKMVIQAYGPIYAEKEVALHFKASQNGMYTINQKELLNLNSSQQIYLFDSFNNYYHDLTSTQEYSFNSDAGDFPSRFKVVFQNSETLSIEQNSLQQLNIYYNNSSNSLHIKNLNENIEQLDLYNALGQKILSKKDINITEAASGVLLNQQSDGVYIAYVKTKNSTFSKKLIIKNN